MRAKCSAHRRQTDRFKAPLITRPRYANGGAYPPDMSLLVKARHCSADYVYAVLTGYEEAPDVELGPNMHYNKYSRASDCDGRPVDGRTSLLRRWDGSHG